MKTLFIDCSMGAAGDMLTAALLELVPEGDAIIRKLNSLIPGVEVSASKTKKCGITGTHVSVKIDGKEELVEDVHYHGHEHGHEHGHDHGHHDHDHEHGHDHGHHHDHPHGFDHMHDHHRDNAEVPHDHAHGHGHTHSHAHRGMADIKTIVSAMDISDKIKGDILSVYGIIAEAEGKAHETDVTQIHFHEVGEKDAIMDITAVCMLMDAIAPDEVVVSPVHVGKGYVKCAHGILPVPAPATAHILRGVPIYSGAVDGELCTPTGAALLKYFATRFDRMPCMITKSIGYGMGTKDFEIANCVRIHLGEDGRTAANEAPVRADAVSVAQTDPADEGLYADRVFELSFNVDDMTAEEIGYAMEKIYEAGAKEVFTIPVGMKKNRPGTLVNTLCYKEDRDKIVETIFKHTSTIGIRKTEAGRYVLDRKEERINTPYGEIRCKISEGYGCRKTKLEYDDLKTAAEKSGKSIAEIKRAIGSDGPADEEKPV